MKHWTAIRMNKLQLYITDESHKYVYKRNQILKRVYTSLFNLHKDQKPAGKMDL